MCFISLFLQELESNDETDYESSSSTDPDWEASEEDE